MTSLFGASNTRVIEHVECIEVEAQPEPLVDREFLTQRHVEADLERRAEHVAARTAEKRFIDIAAGGIAWRHAICARGNELRRKVVSIQYGFSRVDTQRAL